MGASYNETTMPYEPANRIRDKWPGIVTEARYDHGHSGYSGSFAEKPDIEFPGPTFKTDKEAREYVEENNDKWGPVLAVYVEQPEKHWYIGGDCSS